MRTRRSTTPVVAVLLADAGLEVADALTFVVMAVRADAPPSVDQLVILASLILPRLVFAGLALHVGRRVARMDTAIAGAAAGLLFLLAVQAGAGLFLLWGTGATVGGRAVLAGANLVAAVAVARGPAARMARQLADRRRAWRS